MLQIFKSLLVTACLFAFALNTHAEPPLIKADSQRINSACQKDAEESGCGGKVVGKGLLRCMHEYKESHKDHKFSEACRAAMKEMHEDRKEAKGKK